MRERKRRGGRCRRGKGELHDVRGKDNREEDEEKRVVRRTFIFLNGGMSWSMGDKAGLLVPVSGI